MPLNMDKDKVLKLAELSRIKISEAEADNLSHEFEAILDYVGEVKDVSSSHKSALTPENFTIRNSMREDSEPHASGLYTEKILTQAPSREGDYIKVKKIL